MLISDTMKKLYSLLFRLTLIKKEIYVSVDNTVVIKSKVMLKKDFATKYFLEVKAVAIRTKPPSVINCRVAEFISCACHHLPMKVL